MADKQSDVISGKSMLSTGPVEAVLDLKKHQLTVTLDTNGDGVPDAKVIGEPSSRMQGNGLSDLLYREAMALANSAKNGAFSEQDVRSLGITARGIKSLHSGDC